MHYLTAIKTALFLFPILAFFLVIPFLLNQYHKYGSINPLRTLLIYSFILYLLIIYFLVILPLPNKEELKPLPKVANLIPFSFLKDFLRETSFVINDPSTYLKALKEPCFYVVVFNIFMTIPNGMYLRYYFQCSLKKTAGLTFLLSLFFELTQRTGLYFIYPYPYRLFDVDDLLLNTLGGILGYFLAKFLLKILPSREKIDADSIRMGSKVSGLRRITLFFLDTFLFLFFTLASYLFFPKAYLKYIVFFLYYIFIPFFTGSTLGGKFLNVRLEFLKNKYLNLPLRILFLYFYYFYLPYLTIVLASKLNAFLSLTSIETIGLFLFLLILLFLFGISHFFLLLAKGKMYYDKFFQVSYQSTILEKEKKKLKNDEKEDK